MQSAFCDVGYPWYWYGNGRWWAASADCQGMQDCKISPFTSPLPIPFHSSFSLDLLIETAGKAPFAGHVAATDRDPGAISCDLLASFAVAGRTV